MTDQDQDWISSFAALGILTLGVFWWLRRIFFAFSVLLATRLCFRRRRASAGPDLIPGICPGLIRRSGSVGSWPEWDLDQELGG